METLRESYIKGQKLKETHEKNEQEKTLKNPVPDEWKKTGYLKMPIKNEGD